MKPEIAFGKILRIYREINKISQERLALESGLDRTYISLLERGLRQPSLTSILKLSEAFHVSSAKLIAEVEALLDEDS
ncbi:MAG: helix-turn-helix transcriptional regulator [Deltaproteobacteria bacterium]|nr:helix-turn-helix transcriptional regulator [Deltaproteobacteria bacterium]